MNSSQDLDLLFTALSQAQAEISDPKKDKKGYGYQYADLSQVLQIIRPIFAKHGLSIVQFPINSGDSIGIETRIQHKSGQWIESSILIPLEKAKGMSLEQSVGKTITYLRRYCVSAAVGIAADEDTDGTNKTSAKDPGDSAPVIDKELRNAQKLLQNAAKHGIEELSTVWQGLPKGQQKALESVKNDCKKQALEADMQKVVKNVSA